MDGQIIVTETTELETADSLTQRLHISDVGLRQMIKRGFPAPIKIGKRRWFDRRKVDAWIAAKLEAAANAQ